MRRRSRFPLTGLLGALFLAAGCASMGAGIGLDEEPYETGRASFYGSEFHGRRTASGERYDHQEMTAAHRTLPFGTRVRVTNVTNGKSVVVRITDRGPFRKGRVIDVSKRAARELGFVRQGTTEVELRVVSN